MKRLVAIALAGLVGFGIALPASAQSVDEVLAKHFEAMGGVESWTGLNTMEASGTISIMGGMMEGPFHLAQQRPAKSRMDFTLQGADIIQAYDGETAWQVMPLIGITTPQKADPATAATIIEQSDMDGPLIGWKEAGTTVELAGNEMIGTTDAIKLAVTLKNGEKSEYFLDASTYLPIRVVANAAGAATTTTLSDYRDVGGLLFPFTIDVSSEIPITLTFDDVKINIDVDESVFAMPAGN